MTDLSEYLKTRQLKDIAHLWTVNLAFHAYELELFIGHEVFLMITAIISLSWKISTSDD